MQTINLVCRDGVAGNNGNPREYRHQSATPQKREENDITGISWITEDAPAKTKRSSFPHTTPRATLSRRTLVLPALCWKAESTTVGDISFVRFGRPGRCKAY